MAATSTSTSRRIEAAAFTCTDPLPDDCFELALLFLDGPADVLRAATACHWWRELACADSVWRAKAVREDIIGKARAFEVPLPPASAGKGGSIAPAAAADQENEELAGVGLAFYAQIYVLQVPTTRLTTRSTARSAAPALTTAPAVV